MLHSFVSVTLAVKPPETPVSFHQVQTSCSSEQFPEETNEAGQTSICGSERGRADNARREQSSRGFGRTHTGRFNRGFLLQHLEMSLILTALDKLAYFLSLIALCVSVSHSWMK